MVSAWYADVLKQLSSTTHMLYIIYTSQISVLLTQCQATEKTFVRKGLMSSPEEGSAGLN